MKWSIIKYRNYFAIALFLIAICHTGTTTAFTPALQDTTVITIHDTLYLPSPETESIAVSPVKPSRYDRRVHRYRRHWEALIPTHTKLQFAGNMGLRYGVGLWPTEPMGNGPVVRLPAQV